MNPPSTVEICNSNYFNSFFIVKRVDKGKLIEMIRHLHTQYVSHFYLQIIFFIMFMVLVDSAAREAVFFNFPKWVIIRFSPPKSTYHNTNVHSIFTIPRHQKHEKRNFRTKMKFVNIIYYTLYIHIGISCKKQHCLYSQCLHIDLILYLYTCLLITYY